MPTGKEVCDNARAVIGYPYVFGGNSPETGGFDCSGLVQYAYKKSGINIPRTTYNQINIGKKITNKDDLIEGDLIFNFDDKGIPQHVFLYSGNGKVIEARQTGTFISEYSYWNWEGQAIRIIDTDDSKNMDDTKQEVENKPVSTKTMFRVIAGSYTSRVNANRQQEILSNAGFTSFIALYQKADVIYRVVAGSFEDRENAVKRQQELSAKGIVSFLLAYR